MAKSLKKTVVGMCFSLLFVFLAIDLNAATEMNRKARSDETASSSQQLTMSESTYLNLHLTHAMYSMVLGSYFIEGDAKYRAKYLANKNYLLSFMSTWLKLIDSEKYRSTKEIFLEISRRKSYLSRYFETWKKMHDPKQTGEVNLGDCRNQFLTYVYKSENLYKTLDERVVAVLRAVNLYLLTNSHDYDTSQMIAQAYLVNENPFVREAAQKIIEGIPVQKGLVVLRQAIDIFSLSRAAFGNFNLYRVFGGVKMPRGWWSRTRLAMSALGKTGRQIGSRLIANPIVKKLKPIHYSAAISAGVHAGVFLNLGKANKAQQLNTEGRVADQNEKMIFSMMKLLDVIAEKYPDFLHSEDVDFVPSYLPSTKGDLIGKALAYLKGNWDGKFDFLNSFIGFEKLENIDHRKSDDFLAIEFENNEVKNLQSLVENHFGSRVLSDEDISYLRQLAIDGPLTKYKRDYPNLYATLMGWGGNCVAQTMLIAGLLSPYRNRLPKGKQLGIAIFPQHVEPVLYDGQYVTYLVSGKEKEYRGELLYKPEVLLYWVLKNYRATDHFTNLDFLLLPLKTSEKSGSNGSNFSAVKGLLNQLFTIKDTREGILEMAGVGDIVPPGYSTGNNPTKGIPYAADLEYSDILRLDPSEMDVDIGSWIPYSHPEAEIKEINIIYKNMEGIDQLGFEFDENARQLVVYDRDTWVRFVKLKAEKGMNDEKFKRALLEKVNSDLVQFSNSQEYKKHIVNPAAEMKSLENLTPQDVQSWFTLTDQLHKKLIYQAYALKYGSKTSLDDRALLRINLDPEVPAWNAMRSQIEEKMRQYLEQIVVNPELYLELFNKGNEDFKRYLNARSGISSSGRKILFQFNISSWSPDLDDFSTYMVRNAVYEYLRLLDKAEVRFPPVKCSPLGIQLPVAYWGEVYGSQNCVANPQQQAKKMSIKNAENQNGELSRNMVFDVSALIELTLTFQAGIQLWSDDVVDAFISGKYEPISFSRNEAIGFMDVILKYNYPDLESPAINKLRAYLKTQI